MSSVEARNGEGIGTGSGHPSQADPDLLLGYFVFPFIAFPPCLGKFARKFPLAGGGALWLFLYVVTHTWITRADYLS